MSSAIVQLLVLAGIAIFLILRLKNVLGTRDGFEKPPESPSEPNNARANFEVIEGGPDHDIIDHAKEGGRAATALAKMKAAEPSFNVSEFLGGARSAYEMILMGFENGELEKISPFLSDEVNDVFSDVIADRKEKGLIVDATFLGVRETTLMDAKFNTRSGKGEVTVKFVGELTSVVRDKSGDIIEGNPKEIKKQKDVWTFARKMGADDPNWLLVATGG